MKPFKVTCYLWIIVLSGWATTHEDIARSETQQAGTIQISQFLNLQSDQPTVMINAGSQQGIVDGAIFVAKRRRHLDHNFINLETPTEDLWITTGKLKAIKVAEHFTIAHVIEKSSLEAQAFFPKFPEVMAGDRVEEQQPSIMARTVITPTVILPFKELFLEHTKQPQTYELTSEGRHRLREAAAAFAHRRVKKLIIEGHTDQLGDENMNQVESYQRALTIRQFLISELKFDPQRVIALGFGEKELIVKDLAPHHSEVNRRIVIKVIE